MTGADSRNEKRAASWRAKPSARLAVIVMPERDVPGISATAWASPISSAYAAIGFEPGDGFFVQDLGSTNGTRVNGKAEKRAVVAAGDEIQMGKLRLRIQLPERD